MGKAISIMWSDFVSLLFPQLCVSCSDALVKGEEILCLKCLSDLPLTGYESYSDNPVAKIFWGRADVEFATAFCFFEKGNKIQVLLHKLKYKGDRGVGIFLGKLFGAELLDKSVFEDIDLIIPVPLHSRKKRIRGFNQSEEIAKGISEVLNKELNASNLLRIQNTESQTRKSRFVRWENVETAFEVKQPEIFIGKHILLIDDVVTTGATLEACCLAFSGIEEVKISIATVACA
jgi:ComF family protein